MRKELAHSGGSAPAGLGGQVGNELQALRESQSTDDFSGTRSRGANALIAQFARLAEVLDAAGLGPADYLYSSLKWRLQRPRINQYPLAGPLLRLLWQGLTNPPMVPYEVRHAAILAASSYVV